MRILCRHGFFSFYPETENDLAIFCRNFEVDLVKHDDFYTFPFLNKAPCFSIKGAQYLNLLASKTFEGSPWDVMRENKFVYSIQGEQLILSTSVINTVDINYTNFGYLVESALIQPGSRDDKGKIIMSYDADYDQSFHRMILRGYWSE